MTHQLLLVSGDAALALRLRRALPPAIATELHCTPRYEPCPDRHGWLLILWDALAPAGESRPEGAAPRSETPVLWLAQPPHLTGAGVRPGGLPGPIVDFLSRDEAPSKLAFVLSQHLAAAYLRRMRALAPLAWPANAPAPLAADAGAASGADFAERQRQLNNALTGILGNAELALEGGRRLPPGLGQRLTRIVELAAAMREALAQAAEAEGGRSRAA